MSHRQVWLFDSLPAAIIKPTPIPSSHSQSQPTPIFFPSKLKQVSWIAMIYKLPIKRPDTPGQRNI